MKLTAAGMLLLSASLAAAEPPAGRLTATFEGIECEYSPGQEELARLLAHRFVLHNQEIAATQTAARLEPSTLPPLSPTEMRANRAVYLGRIAALLALEKPTASQEDCYDAFLANYEETMILFDALRTGYRSLQVVKRVAVWERAELVRRFERGEKVAGMTYDPATKSGSVSYGGNIAETTNARLQELEEERRKLSIVTNLNVETKDGVTNYRGHFDLAKHARHDRAPVPVALSAPAPAGGVTQWFPVIIPSGLPQAPPEKLAQILWTGMGDGSVEKKFDYMTQVADSIPHIDPQIAFLVLHETTEVGIVDRYFRGRDRRWFCDGVANYVAWRVLRDLQGDAAATQVHNLTEQLRKYSDLRERADLRKWPAAENESETKKHSRLDEARYVFAERAVALMNEHAGEDILPRLFTEIGKTKPDKVTIKTVEEAWRKVSGTELDTILEAAVQPLPAAVSGAK